MMAVRRCPPTAGRSRPVLECPAIDLTLALAHEVLAPGESGDFLRRAARGRRTSRYGYDSAGMRRRMIEIPTAGPWAGARGSEKPPRCGGSRWGMRVEEFEPSTTGLVDHERGLLPDLLSLFTPLGVKCFRRALSASRHRGKSRVPFGGLRPDVDGRRVLRSRGRRGPRERERLRRTGSARRSPSSRNRPRSRRRRRRRTRRSGRWRRRPT